MAAGNVYTVGQINSYIKNMFDEDFMLRKISIKGEVSNCKYHSAGHIYFSLKDDTGVISCIMFAKNRSKIAFHMENGDKVIAGGRISVYERDGTYQMYADSIKLDGVGQLYIKFEELKHRLEEMGMFADEYKQPIPQFASKIGIVTAKTGAAVRDIIQISKRRNPFVQLILFPAIVQGENAPESIVEGINVLDSMNLDIIIVGRGGGSIEDLWAFNEEIVARAIFECHTPVISAVGHETDNTIADFVADLRAPTPSAAAELAVFEFDDLKKTLDLTAAQVGSLMLAHINIYANRLEKSKLRLKAASPVGRYERLREQVFEKRAKLEGLIGQKINENRARQKIIAGRLDALSPLKKLSLGYSYTTVCGSALTSVNQVEPNDEIDINVCDGGIKASVVSKYKVKRENI